MGELQKIRLPDPPLESASPAELAKWANDLTQVLHSYFFKLYDRLREIQEDIDDLTP